MCSRWCTGPCSRWCALLARGYATPVCEFLGLATLRCVQVEAQANKYFQQIYTSQQSIADIVDMLKQFKNSDKPQEREIFTCMIHNLFDEYRFFHKYPDKELRISGLLFGNIIQHQLVVTTTLGIALRCVA